MKSPQVLVWLVSLYVTSAAAYGASPPEVHYSAQVLSSDPVDGTHTAADSQFTQGVPAATSLSLGLTSAAPGSGVRANAQAGYNEPEVYAKSYSRGTGFTAHYPTRASSQAATTITWEPTSSVPGGSTPITIQVEIPITGALAAHYVGGRTDRHQGTTFVAEADVRLQVDGDTKYTASARVSNAPSTDPGYLKHGDLSVTGDWQISDFVFHDTGISTDLPERPLVTGWKLAKTSIYTFAGEVGKTFTLQFLVETSTDIPVGVEDVALADFFNTGSYRIKALDTVTGAPRADVAFVVAPLQDESTPTVGPPVPIPVSSQAHNETDIAAAHNGSTFLVVWSDDRRGVDNLDVYGARLSLQGQLLDPQGLAIGVASNRQSPPAVAGTRGGYLVVWGDTRNYDASNWDVYGARVASDGTVLDPGGIPICTLSGYQGNPAVADLGDRYFVVWEDSRNSATSKGDLYGTFVTAAGAVLHTSGFAVTTATGDQLEPSVASNSSSILVAWEDRRQGTVTAGGVPLSDIWGTLVSSTGGILTPSEIPINAGPNTQRNPSVAGLGGQFFVGWGDGVNLGLSEEHVFGARVTGSGAVLDPAGISISPKSRHGLFPSVGSSGCDVLVVWDDRGVGGEGPAEVHGARIDSSGNLTQRLLVAQNRVSSKPAVAAGGATYLVAYQESQGGPDWDVYSAVLDSAALQIELEPSGLVILSWPTCCEYVLEKADAVTGPWETLGGAASPFPAPVVSAPVQFYRLRAAAVGVAAIPPVTSAKVITQHGVEFHATEWTPGTFFELSVKDMFPSPTGDQVNEVWVSNSEAGAYRNASIEFPAAAFGPGPTQVCVDAAHYNRLRLEAYDTFNQFLSAVDHTAGQNILQRLVLGGGNIRSVRIIGAEITINEVFDP